MRNILKRFAIISMMASVLELSLMVHLNRLWPLGYDYLILLLYLFLPNLILSLLLLLVMALFIRMSPDSSSSLEKLGTYALPIAGYVFTVDIVTGLVKFIYYENPPTFRWVILIVSGGLFLLFSMLFFLAGRYRQRLGALFESIGLNLSRVAILFTIMVFVSLYRESQEKIPHGNPILPSDESVLGADQGSRDHRSAKINVLLLGLDGVSWDSLDRLAAEGRIPNLAALKETGSWGELETVRPTISPLLWTSISTGKVESKHGIHDFKTVQFPGVRPFKTTLTVVKFPSLCSDLLFRSDFFSHHIIESFHYTSRMRTCKNLWNILSECGSTVCSVGWYMSWPAEKVQGYMISDRTFLYPEAGGMAEAGLTYPEDLYTEISHCVVDESTVTLDSLLWLCDPPEREGDRWRTGCSNVLSEYFPAVRKNYARDRTTLGMSIYMLEHRPQCDVTMLYFRAVDSMNHIVHHQVYECGDDLGDSLYIISDNYYEFVDHYVGELIDRLEDGTVLLIISDHGWVRGVGHPYAPDGVLMMHGGPTRVGYHLEGANIFDIAPTVLYLQGLPVATDMDGKPLLAGLEQDFTDQRPVGFVPTYEALHDGSSDRENLQPVKSKVDDEIDEQLKALGYIE